MACERDSTPFTGCLARGQVIRVPISHGEGNFVADPATLETLERRRQVVFRYCDQRGEPAPEANPNGSRRNIAGIVSERGNVLGMMPHPERCAEPELGGDDGLLLFRSVLEAAASVTLA